MYQVTNNGRSVFFGSLAEIKNWLDNNGEYVGKMVTFNYRSSNFDRLRRVVMVHEVDADHIKGIDLTRRNSSNRETGYRTFIKSRISNMELVNINEVLPH